MKLLLVRHGPAADRRVWGARGKDDSLRPLTEDGRGRTREAAEGLARIVDPPDLLASSPYTRALETATLLARAFGRAGGDLGEPVELRALVPDGDPADLLPWLSQQAGDGLVLLTGHEPQLGRLASWLVARSDQSLLEIKKAGACLIDLGREPRPGRARLLWLLTPSHLRRVGRGGRKRR